MTDLYTQTLNNERVVKRLSDNIFIYKKYFHTYQINGDKFAYMNTK